MMRISADSRGAHSLSGYRSAAATTSTAPSPPRVQRRPTAVLPRHSRLPRERSKIAASIALRRQPHAARSVFNVVFRSALAGAPRVQATSRHDATSSEVRGQMKRVQPSNDLPFPTIDWRPPPLSNVSCARHRRPPRQIRLERGRAATRALTRRAYRRHEQPEKFLKTRYAAGEKTSSAFEPPSQMIQVE